MNRLQKKCLIASIGFHLLLGIILFIGPAFLSTNPKPEDAPVIEFLPDITTDSQMAGGGNRNAGSPTPVALPTPPTPVPTPPARMPVVEKEKTSPPEPVKREKIKEVTPPDEKPLPKDPPKNSKPKIEVNTRPVIRNVDTQAVAKARAAAEARAVAEQNRRVASAINGATTSIERGVSKGTDIKLSPGFGGGPSYGNWLSGVKKVYTDAWVVPDGVTDDSATVTASVTIARNGEVLSTSIVKSSGNPLVDHSVKATLDRVVNAPPLPDGAKEDQRTVTINFNVKAKLGQG